MIFAINGYEWVSALYALQSVTNLGRADALLRRTTEKEIRAAVFGTPIPDGSAAPSSLHKYNATVNLEPTFYTYLLSVIEDMWKEKRVEAAFSDGLLSLEEHLREQRNDYDEDGKSYPQEMSGTR